MAGMMCDVQPVLWNHKKKCLFEKAHVVNGCTYVELHKSSPSVQQTIGDGNRFSKFAIFDKIMRRGKANYQANQAATNKSAEDLGLGDGEMPVIRLKENAVVAVSVRERSGEETTFNVLLGPSIKTVCVEFKVGVFELLERLTTNPLSESEDEVLKDQEGIRWIPQRNSYQVKHVNSEGKCSRKFFSVKGKRIKCRRLLKLVNFRDKWTARQAADYIFRMRLSK